MRIPSAVVAIALAPVIVAGQQAPNAGPAVDPNIRFDVVAIKALGGDNVPAVMRMSPGRFDSAVQAGLLLRQALLKADYEIIGMPAWADVERYSIAAKTPDGTPLAALSVLLRNLLKDRFQLAKHLETRELPIANLVLARADRRLGPNLKVTSAECQAEISARLAGSSTLATGRGGAPPALPPLPGPNDPVPCGFGSGRVGFVSGSGRTLVDIASALSDFVGRPVIDKTGLTGMYDFTLRFAQEGRAGGAAGVFSGPAGPPAPIDPEAPSLAAALRDQLGLKLESTRGPVEVVVIDKFEKPTLD